MTFKEFLNKWVFNNILYKIIALVAAFVLWLVILNVTDPAINRTIQDIPVTIENEETVLDGTRIYRITQGKDISVTVTGNRSIVSQLKASDFTATANFAELSITNAVPINVKLTGENAKYASQVTITPRISSMILETERIKTKSVEVGVEFTGVCADNMTVDYVNVNPTFLTVTAPESVLESIERAVAAVDYSQINGESRIRVAPVLKNKNGKVIEWDEYTKSNYKEVLVTVQPSYTKTVAISHNYTGEPAEGYELVSAAFSADQAVVRGSAEDLEGFTMIEIPEDEFSIEGAEENITIGVDMTQYLPDGITVAENNKVLTFTAVIRKKPETSAETETSS
ncbi:MAG: hypothetical protein HUJ75_07630, partial [Parasporobacterium sp.]|nr:hypothetical protein [Parasporobacterium sp.]